MTVYSDSGGKRVRAASIRCQARKLPWLFRVRRSSAVVRAEPVSALRCHLAEVRGYRALIAAQIRDDSAARTPSPCPCEACTAYGYTFVGDAFYFTLFIGLQYAFFLSMREDTGNRCVPERTEEGWSPRARTSEQAESSPRGLPPEDEDSATFLLERNSRIIKA